MKMLCYVVKQIDLGRCCRSLFYQEMVLSCLVLLLC